MTTHPGVRVIPFNGNTPRIHASAFIAPGCTLIGDVEIGADSSVWYNCVLRADTAAIRIGERTNIQDGSVLHGDPPRPGDPEGSPLLIGNDVLVGHMVMLHGCRIEDRGFVGLGAIARPARCATWTTWRSWACAWAWRTMSKTPTRIGQQLRRRAKDKVGGLKLRGATAREAA